MECSDLLSVLQIVDSAFPTGGFSHSLGLESYVQYVTLIKCRKEPQILRHAFVCILENTGSLLLPFVRSAYRLCFDNQENSQQCKTAFLLEETDACHYKNDGLGQSGRQSRDTFRKCTDLNDRQCENICENKDTLESLDLVCEACTMNHIASRASTRQGKSLREVSQLVFPKLRDETIKQLNSLPHCHYPVVYGASLAGLGLPLDVVLTSFMFCTVRALVATAVRLDVLGAMEGQRLQHSLQELVPDIIQRNESKSLDEACVRFPCVDILQNTHDKIFAKLFYS